jgi:hypothetical protein
MANEYSMASLLNFLDYEREKGLVKDATVSARKAAVNAMLGILDPEEAADLRQIDIDNVMVRFSNLNGSKFTPDSLKTYKSRVSSALSDFLAYRESPMNFKPGLTARTTKRSKSTDNDDKLQTQKTPFIGPSSGADYGTSSTAFPIPIRPDLTVRIVGLPSDLTTREASKIAKVVMALAHDDEQE